MSSRPRILFIQTQAENAGAQEISRLLGEGLDPKGYDIHHLFFYRKSTSFNEPPNTVFCVQDRPRTALAFAKFLFRLVRQIAAIKPDVVLTFQHYGNLFGAPAARLAGVRHVIANQVSAPKTMNDKIRAIDKLWGRIGMYDTITVNSVDTAADYAGYPEPYAKRMVHVPHGFRDKSSKLTKPEARQKFGLPQDVILLGSVARLNPLKRLDVAIRALTHNECWHLALGGQGPDELRLQSIAEGLGVANRVHFTGEMNPEAVGDFLASLDLFVFPSEAETFGLAAVEAAQAGLPIVANDLPVLREVLQTELGSCALFADSDEPDSYVEPIRKLLSDHVRAGAMAKAARELKKLYSLDAMINAYDRLIMQQGKKQKSRIKQVVA
nr:glycosyltransferase family 4 protein [uncultured Cohaesibacter sp.]